MRLELSLDDSPNLGALFGQYDKNLAVMEEQLGVQIAARGGMVTITGATRATQLARDVLLGLQRRVQKTMSINPEDVTGMIALLQQSPIITNAPHSNTAPPAISTRRKRIVARTQTQIDYMEALATAKIIFALGPAGTGKTYLAVARAINQLINGGVARLILSRPVVEAGERLGFLPGDMREKIDPYLRPLYDALHDMLPGEEVEQNLNNGDIEIAPLAFMRGRTLNNAFIILDEAQNTTPGQMKMFLTRFGQGARMVICGDPQQTDIPAGEKSGLVDAVERLGDIPEIAILHFSNQDIVRHPLVGHILAAYETPVQKGNGA